MNSLRRRIGEFFARHDVWVSPTTALVSQPHGIYNQGRADISAEDYLPFSDRPVQFCFPTTSRDSRPSRCRLPGTPTACRSACSWGRGRPRSMC
jgi:hypothetical protein